MFDVGNSPSLETYVSLRAETERRRTVLLDKVLESAEEIRQVGLRALARARAAGVPAHYPPVTWMWTTATG